MLINRAAKLVCTAEGTPGFKLIKWRRGTKELSSLPEANISTRPMISLTANIDFEEWSNGETYTCEVEHQDFTRGYETKDYRRESGRYCFMVISNYNKIICKFYILKFKIVFTCDQCSPTYESNANVQRWACFELNCNFLFIGKIDIPEVYLLPPPDSSDQWVTLTCYVKDFYPQEVAVSWLVDDKIVETSDHNYKQNTTSAITRDDLFSVYSQLIVNTSHWNAGKVFTCRVYHESIKDPVRLISRSISSQSNPATLVNLSLNVPSLCPHS